MPTTDPDPLCQTPRRHTVLVQICTENSCHFFWHMHAKTSAQRLLLATTYQQGLDLAAPVSNLSGLQLMWPAVANSALTEPLSAQQQRGRFRNYPPGQAVPLQPSRTGPALFVLLAWRCRADLAWLFFLIWLETALNEAMNLRHAIYLGKSRIRLPGVLPSALACSANRKRWAKPKLCPHLRRKASTQDLALRPSVPKWNPEKPG